MTQGLWKIGTRLQILSILGMVGICVAAAYLDIQGHLPGTIESKLLIPSFVMLSIFVAGSIIVWLFALKFYRKRSFFFSPVQSSMYLLLLICLLWLAPYVFIWIEGRERFFDFES